MICRRSVRRGIMQLVVYCIYRACIRAWMSITAIQTVKMASTTKANTYLTSIFIFLSQFRLPTSCYWKSNRKFTGLSIGLLLATGTTNIVLGGIF